MVAVAEASGPDRPAALATDALQGGPAELDRITISAQHHADSLATAALADQACGAGLRRAAGSSQPGGGKEGRGTPSLGAGQQVCAEVVTTGNITRAALSAALLGPFAPSFPLKLCLDMESPGRNEHQR